MRVSRVRSRPTCKYVRCMQFTVDVFFCFSFFFFSAPCFLLINTCKANTVHWFLGDCSTEELSVLILTEEYRCTCVSVWPGPCVFATDGTRSIVVSHFTHSFCTSQNHFVYYFYIYSTILHDIYCVGVEADKWSLCTLGRRQTLYAYVRSDWTRMLPSRQHMFLYGFLL